MDIDFVKKLIIDEKNLNFLNNHFEQQSYSVGFCPSAVDTALSAKISHSTVTLTAYPHLRRWHKHILSYNQQNKFPQFAKV